MKLLLAFTLASVAFSQVLAPNDAGVSMGHLHIKVAEPELQKKFWTGVLGAEPRAFGSFQVYPIPGVLVVVEKKAEAGAGTDGSVVNHIGVKVQNLEDALAKCKENGITVDTHTPPRAMVVIGGGIRVELTEDTALPAAAVNHHIHFYTPDVQATQAWYVRVFGATPGKRGPFDAADVPGVNLTFSKSETPLEGTKGRALDHIGFEVRNLEAFTKHLAEIGVKLDLPFTHVPALKLDIAFLTDPWGTFIELTEGLNRPQTAE